MNKNSLLVFLNKIFLFILRFYAKYKKGVNKTLIMLLCFALLLFIIEINNRYDLFYWWTIPNYILLWYLIARTTLRRIIKLLNQGWDDMIIDLTWLYGKIIAYFYRLYFNHTFILLFIVFFFIIIVAMAVAYYISKKFKK